MKVAKPPTVEQLRKVAGILKLPMFKTKAALREQIIEFLEKQRTTSVNATTLSSRRKSLSRHSTKRQPARKRKSVSRVKSGRKSASVTVSQHRKSHKSSRSAQKSRKSSSHNRRRKPARRVSNHKSRRSVGHKSAMKTRKSTSRHSVRRSPASGVKRRSTSGVKRRSTSVVKRNSYKPSKPITSLPSTFNVDTYSAAISRVAKQGYTEVVSTLYSASGNKIWTLLRQPGTTTPATRVTIWGPVSAPVRHTYGGIKETDASFVDSKLKKGYAKNQALNRLTKKMVK